MPVITAYEKQRQKDQELRSFLATQGVWDSEGTITKPKRLMFTYLDCAEGVICWYMLATVRLCSLDICILLLTSCFSKNSNVAIILESITISPRLLYQHAYSLLPPIYLLFCLETVLQCSLEVTMKPRLVLDSWQPVAQILIILNNKNLESAIGDES